MKLNAEQLIELAKIGTIGIFIENDNKLKLSWDGVTRIIKAYEKIKQEHDAQLTATIAQWDKELEKSFTFDFSQISDEEIYKAAQKATYDDKLDWENQHALEAFIKGVDWYKEQLKHEL